MNGQTELSHQVKRKRDPDADPSPAGPSYKRQRHDEGTVSGPTQDVAEQELAYRPRETANRLLPEVSCENGIQLVDISSKKLPAARADIPLAIQSKEKLKSPRKRVKGARKPTNAIADSEDEEDTIVVNGSKDADFVPDTEIMSHFKATRPKLKQKRKKPNPPVDPLFWQPFELTGDLIDDPDDDGDGLHGVGFELPPERAYAVRREKRQKIADWKAAVASETRMARSNRRSILGPHSESAHVQGDIASVSEIDAAKQDETGKKAVRFAA